MNNGGCWGEKRSFSRLRLGFDAVTAMLALKTTQSTWEKTEMKLGKTVIIMAQES